MRPVGFMCVLMCFLISAECVVQSLDTTVPVKFPNIFGSLTIFNAPTDLPIGFSVSIISPDLKNSPENTTALFTGNYAYYIG